MTSSPLLNFWLFLAQTAVVLLGAPETAYFTGFGFGLFGGHNVIFGSMNAMFALIADIKAYRTKGHRTKGHHVE